MMQWSGMFQKITKLMDALPDDVRLMVIQKYWEWEPKSNRVKKIIKVIKALSQDEKKELMVFINDVLQEESWDEEIAKESLSTEEDNNDWNL